MSVEGRCYDDPIAANDCVEDDCNKGYDESIIEVCMEDDPLTNSSSTPPAQQSVKKKIQDDDLIKDAYKNMTDLITTAKTAFSETSPVRTFLHSLALQIEEANLSFENMSVLQMELLTAVHNAIKRQNNID